MTQYCDAPRPGNAPILAADDPAGLDEAVDLLRRGRLVAFPTDTVYGIGADARQTDSIAEIYIAKGRPPEKAIPLLVADVSDMQSYVAHIPDAARRLMDAFWPGGLTLVLPIAAGAPAIISAGPGIAVRMPDHPTPLALIRRLGAPLAATSANRSGHADPLTAGAVAEQLGRRIELILDGGPTPGGRASTVLDLTAQPARLLRVGPFSAAQLRAVIGDILEP